MIWTILAVLIWMALGATAALACMALRGYRLWRGGPRSEFGGWLDHECEVLKGDGEWRRCVVVAVSHKGAVAVRNASDGSGRHAKWIAADRVPEIVRWV